MKRMKKISRALVSAAVICLAAHGAGALAEAPGKAAKRKVANKASAAPARKTARLANLRFQVNPAPRPIPGDVDAAVKSNPSNPER